MISKKLADVEKWPKYEFIPELWNHVRANELLQQRIQIILGDGSKKVIFFGRQKGYSSNPTTWNFVWPAYRSHKSSIYIVHEKAAVRYIQTTVLRDLTRFTFERNLESP